MTKEHKAKISYLKQRINLELATKAYSEAALTGIVLRSFLQEIKGK